MESKTVAQRSLGHFLQFEERVTSHQCSQVQGFENDPRPGHRSDQITTSMYTESSENVCISSIVPRYSYMELCLKYESVSARLLRFGERESSHSVV